MTAEQTPFQMCRGHSQKSLLTWGRPSPEVRQVVHKNMAHQWRTREQRRELEVKILNKGVREDVTKRGPQRTSKG